MKHRGREVDIQASQNECQKALIESLDKLDRELRKKYKGVWMTETLASMTKAIQTLRQWNDRGVHPKWMFYYQPPILLEEHDERPGQWCSVCGTSYTFMKSGVCVSCSELQSEGET